VFFFFLGIFTILISTNWTGGWMDIKQKVKDEEVGIMALDK